jgi:hypothetical protein
MIPEGKKNGFGHFLKVFLGEESEFEVVLKIGVVYMHTVPYAGFLTLRKRDMQPLLPNQKIEKPGIYKKF